jgi:dolichol kinase
VTVEWGAARARAAAVALPRHTAHREGLRRAVHAASAVLGPLALWLPGRGGAVLLGALAATAGLVEAARRLWPSVQRAVTGVAGALFRPDEARGPSGATTLAVGYAAAWWLYPPRVGVAAIVVAGLADPAAALAGRRFAAGPGKSWQGSLACALVAALVLLACGAGGLAAAVGGAAAALAERAPWRGADNLLVPLATGAALLLLSPP